MTVFKLEGERNNSENNNRRHVTRKKRDWLASYLDTESSKLSRK
jgi:hypothetical protein